LVFFFVLFLTCLFVSSRPKKAVGGGAASGHSLHNTSAEALQLAIQASMAGVGGGDDSDEEMAAAIAASLSGVSAPGPVAGSSSAGAEESEQRALALSRALSQPEPADGVLLQIRLRDGSVKTRKKLKIVI
jgi:hypothetical protein